MPGIAHKIKSAIGYFRHICDVLIPRGFDGFSVREVLRFIGTHYNFQGLTEKAAAMSYNFIMSIPPTCLFLFTLIPNLPFVSKIGIKLQLHRLIRDIIPSPTYNKGLIHFVDGFIGGSKIGLISFTFIISLFFASNAVMGMIRAFNQTEFSMGLKRQKGLRQRWSAIKLTLMLFGLLFLTMIFMFLQGNILEWLGIHNIVVKNIIMIAKWVLIGGLIFFSYTFIYRYSSFTARRWRFISPGAVVATVLSIIVSIGFVTFVENFGRYNFLYGSIGTAMVVMVMIFLNSLMIFFGFTLNLTIYLLGKEKKEGPADHAV